MKSALKVRVALALVLLSAMPAEATQHYCEAVVAQRLDHLDVDAADIRKINYIPIYRYTREMTSMLLNAPLPDLRGEHWTKPVPPEPYRLVADIDTPLKQEIFDLPQ